MPKFEENALYVGGKCSKKLAMLKEILMLFMSENAKIMPAYFIDGYTRDQSYVLSGVNAIEDGWKVSY